LDVLHFVTQKVGILRKPRPDERKVISSMKQKAEVLEYFEDFYAGFLQILLQLYVLMLEIDRKFENKFSKKNYNCTSKIES
jgi:hypothetical protein